MQFMLVFKRFGTIAAGQGLGSLAAAIIPLFTLPVITRLYPPEEYALLGFYLVCVTFISPVSMLRYDAAILLPRKNRSALTVAFLCLICATFVSLTALSFMLLFPFAVPAMLGGDDFSWRQYFVPVGIIMNALLFLCMNLALRAGQYHRLAMAKVAASAGTSFSALTFGFLKFEATALIVSQIIGGSFGCLLLFSGTRRYWTHWKASSRISRMRFMARRYIRFPMISLPADLLGGIATQGHLLVTALLFDQADFATVALVQRIIGVATAVMGESFSGIFRREAARIWSEEGSFRQFYVSSFFWLSILSICLFLPLAIVAPHVSATIFGANWTNVCLFLVYLVPFFAFRFVGGVLGYTTYIVERQDIDFWIQLSMLSVVGISALIGFLFDSIYIFLAVFSSGMAIIYIGYIYICFRLSSGANADARVQARPNPTVFRTD